MTTLEISLDNQTYSLEVLESYDQLKERLENKFAQLSRRNWHLQYLDGGDQIQVQDQDDYYSMVYQGGKEIKITIKIQDSETEVKGKKQGEEEEDSIQEANENCKLTEGKSSEDGNKSENEQKSKQESLKEDQRSCEGEQELFEENQQGQSEDKQQNLNQDYHKNYEESSEQNDDPKQEQQQEQKQEQQQGKQHSQEGEQEQQQEQEEEQEQEEDQEQEQDQEQIQKNGSEQEQEKGQQKEQEQEKLQVQQHKIKQQEANQTNSLRDIIDATQSQIERPLQDIEQDNPSSIHPQLIDDRNNNIFRSIDQNSEILQTINRDYVRKEDFQSLKRQFESIRELANSLNTEARNQRIKEEEKQDKIRQNLALREQLDNLRKNIERQFEQIRRGFSDPNKREYFQLDLQKAEESEKVQKRQEISLFICNGCGETNPNLKYFKCGIVANIIFCQGCNGKYLVSLRTQDVETFELTLQK